MILCHSRAGDCVIIKKIAYFLTVMPDLIPAEDGIFDRHPELIEINAFLPDSIRDLPE